MKHHLLVETGPVLASFAQKSSMSHNVLFLHVCSVTLESLTFYFKCRHCVCVEQSMVPCAQGVYIHKPHRANTKPSTSQSVRSLCCSLPSVMTSRWHTASLLGTAVKKIQIFICQLISSLILWNRLFSCSNNKL